MLRERRIKQADMPYSRQRKGRGRTQTKAEKLLNYYNIGIVIPKSSTNRGTVRTSVRLS